MQSAGSLVNDGDLDLSPRITKDLLGMPEETLTGFDWNLLKALSKAAAKHQIPGAWKLRSVILTKGSALPAGTLGYGPALPSLGYGLSRHFPASEAPPAPQCNALGCRCGQDLFCMNCRLWFCGSHASRSFAYLGVRCDACSEKNDNVEASDDLDMPHWYARAVTTLRILSFLDFPMAVIMSSVNWLLAEQRKHVFNFQTARRLRPNQLVFKFPTGLLSSRATPGGFAYRKEAMARTCFHLDVESALRLTASSPQ